ncbi:MAG: PKD domain-containing protein [Sinobacteraceae bacterium]|nr:PKD domain-containing protein [Nevskiaceae bacterium]
MKSSLTVVAALCCLGLLAACGGGGGSSGGAGTAPSQVAPPTAVIKADSGASAGGSGAALEASVGSTIVLVSASTAASGATITAYAWSVTSSPAGSQVSLKSANTATATFVPDVAGTYALQLTVTDSLGQTASQTVSISVNNTPPVAVVISKVVFDDGSSVKPAQNVATGAIISFDATGASTPGDNPAAITWSLDEEPAGSAASLSINGAMAHFTADVAGEYKVRVRATHQAGDFAESTYVFEAFAPPAAVLVAQSGTSVSGTFSAYKGYQIVLDGSASSGPAGDVLTKNWTMSSKPAGSNAMLSASTGNFSNFVADQAGTYIVELSVLDSNTGVTSTFTDTINVVVGPTAQIDGGSSPVGSLSAPTFVGSPGVPVTLRGSGSYEPGGGSLTYLWTLASRPANSSASISSPTSQNITFTPDVAGTYGVILKVTDSAGNSSQQSATLNVGAVAPTAIVNQPQVSVLLGGTVYVSAAASYDPNDLPLTYSWSVDARPSGSQATISGPTASSMSFKPDVAGTYSITVTVSNGTENGVASVALTAFSASAGTVPLGYLPLQVAYSRITGKAAIVSTNPNTLHIVSPSDATDSSVPLPTAVKALALSPNGALAAVLHEGVVSLVDMQAGTIIKSSQTLGSQTMVAVNNNGLLYLLGQTGGQWVSPAITIEDGKTGNFVTPDYQPFAVVYGTMSGIYSDVNDKLYVIASGLSPSEIYDITLDPSTGNDTGYGQAPYWGDYPMFAPFWLSGDQSLLFTAAGNYFQASNLQYVGTFNLGEIQWMSHSATAAEAVVLPAISSSPYYYSTPSQYPASYKRFTGPLLFPAADVPLPLVGGVQSYGIAIFHDASDRHVMLVQTGTSQVNGPAAQYFLIVR